MQTVLQTGLLSRPWKGRKDVENQWLGDEDSNLD
jgi:hypothetical protein